MTVELISAITIAVVTNGAALALGWFKFKTAVLGMSKEVKEHTDVAVQKLNGMLTYFIHSADRPMWIKSVKLENGKPVFRMLEVNDEFASYFGVTRQEYVGKTDLEAGWDKPTSDLFYQSDLAVWASGAPQTFTEVLNGRGMRFRKLLLQTPDGAKKGVMGYAVDCDESNEAVESRAHGLLAEHLKLSTSQRNSANALYK